MEVGWQCGEKPWRQNRGGKTIFEIGANGELPFALKITFLDQIREIEPFHYVHRDRTAKLPQGVVSKAPKLNPHAQICKTGCKKHFCPSIGVLSSES